MELHAAFQLPITGDDEVMVSCLSHASGWIILKKLKERRSGVREGGGVCATKIDSKAYKSRCLRCRESFSCRAPLRILHGKSLRSYVYQCFSDGNVSEHETCRVAAFCMWLEGEFWAPKWQLPGMFWIWPKIAFFWEVNENYEFSKIRRVAAFWTMSKSGPKWQLPGGFLFFEEMQFWTILINMIKFKHSVCNKNAAPPQVLICWRHRFFVLQHAAWHNYALFVAFCSIFTCSLHARGESSWMEFCTKH